MDINVADLDHDGREEILVLTNGSPQSCTATITGGFRMLATVDLANHLRYHTVNHGRLQQKRPGGDLPQRQQRRPPPDSTVLEWNGRKMKTLVDHSPWLSGHHHCARPSPPCWSGQQKVASEFGGGDIFTMQLDTGNEVVAAKQLNLPKRINIFNFTLADIDGDGTPETLAINSDNRLQVYGANGSLRWTSPDLIGASNKFFGTLTSTNNSVNAEKDSVWIHTRIVAADLNKDGVNDIPCSAATAWNRSDSCPICVTLTEAA